MQLVPLPAMNPLQPSSRHILASAFGTDIWYSFRPALWTWKRIFNLSSGETTVLDTAPATPPAMNDARTGCATNSLKRSTREAAGYKSSGQLCVVARLVCSASTFGPFSKPGAAMARSCDCYPLELLVESVDDLGSTAGERWMQQGANSQAVSTPIQGKKGKGTIARSWVVAVAGLWLWQEIRGRA
jgi:hypothetical protein